MTLDELVARCKCSVTVNFNDHRGYYESVAECLDREGERYDDVTPEMRERMIASDTIVEVQFYPETPVGFYFAHGTTLDECLAGAAEVMGAVARAVKP